MRLCRVCSWHCLGTGNSGQASNCVTLRGAPQQTMTCCQIPAGKLVRQLPLPLKQRCPCSTLLSPQCWAGLSGHLPAQLSPPCSCGPEPPPTWPCIAHGYLCCQGGYYLTLRL